MGRRSARCDGPELGLRVSRAAGRGGVTGNQLLRPGQRGEGLSWQGGGGPQDQQWSWPPLTQGCSVWPTWGACASPYQEADYLQQPLHPV